jgi:hypothetical protein
MILIRLGIPVILSKITLSQITADNRTGGTSDIFYSPFITGKNLFRPGYTIPSSDAGVKADFERIILLSGQKRQEKKFT